MSKLHTAGEYLVFVDESGDHSLSSINPQHPVFVLAFVIVRKSDYIEQICPSLQRFKLCYWNHDEVVLHEHEIRKPKGPFSFLLRKDIRERFLQDLSDLMQALPATIIVTVINKFAFAASHKAPLSGIYDHAMKTGIDAVHDFLCAAGQGDKLTSIIVECRGRKEDKELELAFRRHCDVGASQPRSLPLELVMVPKTANSSGLQLADLVARPVSIKHLRPDQPNRAFDIISAKLHRGPDGKLEGWGYHSIPE